MVWRWGVVSESILIFVCLVVCMFDGMVMTNVRWRWLVPANFPPWGGGGVNTRRRFASFAVRLALGWLLLIGQEEEWLLRAIGCACAPVKKKERVGYTRSGPFQLNVSPSPPFLCGSQYSVPPTTLYIEKHTFTPLLCLCGYVANKVAIYIWFEETATQSVSAVSVATKRGRFVHLAGTEGMEGTQNYVCTPTRALSVAACRQSIERGRIYLRR